MQNPTETWKAGVAARGTETLHTRRDIRRWVSSGVLLLLMLPKRGLCILLIQGTADSVAQLLLFVKLCTSWPTIKAPSLSTLVTPRPLHLSLVIVFSCCVVSLS